MTPANVSVVVQPATPVAAAQSNPYSQDEKITPSLTGAEVSSKNNKANPVVSSKDSRGNPVDKVSISGELRQTMADVKKEELKKEKTDPQKATQKLDMSAAKVEFVYDIKGELSIRYLDNASRLVYQVPSELMLSLRESLANSDTSVDTRA